MHRVSTQVAWMRCVLPPSHARKRLICSCWESWYGGDKNRDVAPQDCCAALSTLSLALALSLTVQSGSSRRCRLLSIHASDHLHVQDARRNWPGTVCCKWAFCDLNGSFLHRKMQKQTPPRYCGMLFRLNLWPPSFLLTVSWLCSKPYRTVACLTALV